MSQAALHAQGSRVSDRLNRSGKLGRDGEHANGSCSGLPEAVKRLRGWLDKMVRRMHATFFAADERPFQVNPQGDGAVWTLFPSSNCLGQLIQRLESPLPGSGDSRRQIRGYAVSDKKMLD